VPEACEIEGFEKEDSPAKSSATNAAESDSEEEGAWAIWDSDNNSCDSALFPDSDSDVVASITAVNVPGEDTDWFSEVAEDGCEADDEDWFTEESDDSEDIFMATDEAKPSLDGARTELYNSSCTQHISPCRDQFEKFQEIPPKAFRTANKQSFSAIGKGELVIDIPDGADVSQLRLMEVLYSPEVGYTCKGNPLCLRLPPAFRFCSRSHHLVSLPQRLRSNDILRHPLPTPFRSRSHDVARLIIPTRHLFRPAFRL